MERQRDGKGQASFYRHQHPYDPASKEVRSSLYNHRDELDQAPLNFFGRRALRAPGDDSAAYDPRPMDGLWRAEEHMPIMRTQRVLPKMR
jgi:hypothetical protein